MVVAVCSRYAALTQIYTNLCVCTEYSDFTTIPVHKRSATKINDSLCKMYAYCRHCMCVCVCVLRARAVARVSRGGVFTQSISERRAVGRCERGMGLVWVCNSHPFSRTRIHHVGIYYYIILCLLNIRF